MKTSLIINSRGRFFNMKNDFRMLTITVALHACVSTNRMLPAVAFALWDYSGVICLVLNSFWFSCLPSTSTHCVRWESFRLFSLSRLWSCHSKCNCSRYGSAINLSIAIGIILQLLQIDEFTDVATKNRWRLSSKCNNNVFLFYSHAALSSVCSLFLMPLSMRYSRINWRTIKKTRVIDNNIKNFKYFIIGAGSERASEHTLLYNRQPAVKRQVIKF